jgi:presequence protease
MSHSAFELQRRESISALKITYEEYRHTETGARHIHLDTEDNNNAFLVAFKTVPQDSTGVAHILEHTSLCGSTRYPVRDPFFMMTRRSLSTFMNAFTASDWTAYPFATQSRKDFDNLLQVYLDATFFPSLNELDFLQEGIRTEFAKNDAGAESLVYKGVVFNEMKGAMSAPVQRIWQDLQSALFPTTTYHFNSGGEPSDIPDLTYQQLLDFHARHYHPSNATFMTYGSFPVAEHQARMQELALNQFSRQALDLSIAPEKRYVEPLQISSRFASDEDIATPRSQVVLGWLLGSVKDLDATMDAQMLSSALLDNSASPLRHALETSSLGTAPSEICGFEEAMSEAIFVCGLEGCKPENAEQIQSLILSVLEKVSKDGVPVSQLESILHQIELSQREVGGGRFPYGLQLMVKSLSPALHSADPFKVLNVEPALERLREKIKDPSYIPDLAKSLLLNNKHRVLLTANPDSKLAEEQESQEKARLKKIESSLTDAQKQNIIDLTEALRQRQETEDNPEVLPSVNVNDAPKELKYPEYRKLDINGTSASFFPTATNGLVYQQVVIEIPEMDQTLIDDLPLFCDILNEVGINDLDYLQAQELQASVSGGIHAQLSCRSPQDNLQGLNSFLVLSGKALYRNQAAFSRLLFDTFSGARLDEYHRLRELVAQIRAHREAGITQSGHRLAMQAASAGSSVYANLEHRWDGLQGVRNIIALDAALTNDNEIKNLAGRFAKIKKLINKAPRQFLLINEEENINVAMQTLAPLWQGVPVNTGCGQLHVNFEPTVVNQAWTTSTQVNFCAKSYMTVSSGHEDAAVLTVLGHFLRNGFLHNAIREKGGAYGGGAAFAADSGTFRFYSYRDPRMAETLDEFDQSLKWLQNAKHDSRQVEEAILSVLSDIDRPDSPAGEAIITWFGELHGRSVEKRKAFRKQVMSVTLEDLQRVARQWLVPDQANTAVITHAATLEKYNDTNPENKLEACPLK